MRFVTWTIATALGSGFSPVAPGTAGSLVAVIIAYVFFTGNPLLLPAFSVFFFFVGTVSAHRVATELQREDPQVVVIDEVVGMWITLWWVPHTLLGYVVAFIAFRLFDIWKPFPIKATEKVGYGFGIMLDDVVAGVYGLLLTHAILRVIS